MDVITTMRNMILGPRSMVPMMERPASGVRYGLKFSSMKSRASAVNRIIREAARTSLIAEFALRTRRPKRSRKYPIIPISVATTRPTPISDFQRSGLRIRLLDSICARSPRSTIPSAMIRSIGGRGPRPIRAVSASQVIRMSATNSLTFGSPSIHSRKRSNRVGGRCSSSTLLPSGVFGTCFPSFMAFPVSWALGPFPSAFVGIYYTHDEVAADDVVSPQAHEGDALHPSKRPPGVVQAAHAALGEVDLRNVARDHHLGAEPEARQEHLHLLGGRILRLIEDDERVVQGPASHERKWGYLDYTPLEVRLELS